MSAIPCDVTRCERDATIAVTFRWATRPLNVCWRHDARQHKLRRGHGWQPWQIASVVDLTNRPESVL